MLHVGKNPMNSQTIKYAMTKNCAAPITPVSSCVLGMKIATVFSLA